VREVAPVLNWLAGRHLVILVVGLCGIGVPLVLSAAADLGDWTVYLRGHLLGLLLGVAVAITLARIPLAWLRALGYPAWLLALLLLAVTFVPGVGVQIKGSARWIKLGSVQFQPLEFAKLAVVLALCQGLAHRSARVRDIRVGLLIPALLAGIPAALLLRQPDFGGAVFVCVCAAVLAFIGGARASHLALAAAIVAPAAALVLAAQPYRSGRLEAWYLRIAGEYRDVYQENWQAWEARLSTYAGGWFGIGIGGSQERYRLPEARNDYILSVAGEELGFTGVALILSAFLGIAWGSIAVAVRTSDPFAMLLASGAGLLLWLQAVVNAAVVLDLLPTKGTTLPFLSYGRSSLIVSLAAVGLVLNVARSPGFQREEPWA
jgi:cell division protein FtsW